jgi:hypothetical protein
MFESGNEKFKMAALQQYVPVSQLLHKIAMKIQRLTPRFGVEKLNGAIVKELF